MNTRRKLQTLLPNNFSIFFSLVLPTDHLQNDHSITQCWELHHSPAYPKQLSLVTWTSTSSCWKSRDGWASHKWRSSPAKYTDAENQQLWETFIKWRKTDRLLRGWLIGTLSEETLGLIVGLDTSYADWEALKSAYAQDSQEREFTLRQQVTYLRKEDNTTIIWLENWKNCPFYIVG